MMVRRETVSGKITEREVGKLSIIKTYFRQQKSSMSFNLVEKGESE
jgi:hypothetical protein